MTPSPAASMSESLAERLARRGIRLQAPLRRVDAVKPGPIAADAPPPARIVLGDEIVLGPAAPALWVDPAKAIVLTPKARKRLASWGTIARSSTIH